MQVAPCAHGDVAEVGLRDDEHVGHLHDPGLQELQDVARAGLHDHGDGVGHVGDLRLALPDSDGLDHDDVEGRRERLGRRARGRREAPEAVARRRGADERAGVVRVEGDPGPVPEQRPARAARGRVDGEDGDAAPVLPPGADERAEERRLARPGRAGHADHVPGRLAAERGGGDRGQQLGDRRPRRRRRVLDEVQHGRGGREVALAQAGAERCSVHGQAQAGAAATPLTSATSATMSRMMPVRSKSLGV